MIYKPEVGQNFYNFIKQMRNECIQYNQLYRNCTFNDINITVSNDSNIYDIAIIYDLKRKLTQHNLTY